MGTVSRPKGLNEAIDLRVRYGVSTSKAGSPRRIAEAKMRTHWASEVTELGMGHSWEPLNDQLTEREGPMYRAVPLLASERCSMQLRPCPRELQMNAQNDGTMLVCGREGTACSTVASHALCSMPAAQMNHVFHLQLLHEIMSQTIYF
jgi:hypothetical protein